MMFFFVSILVVCIVSVSQGSTLTVRPHGARPLDPKIAEWLLEKAAATTRTTTTTTISTTTTTATTTTTKTATTASVTPHGAGPLDPQIFEWLLEKANMNADIDSEDIDSRKEDKDQDMDDSEPLLKDEKIEVDIKPESQLNLEPMTGDSEMQGAVNNPVQRKAVKKPVQRQARLFHTLFDILGDGLSHRHYHGHSHSTYSHGTSPLLDGLYHQYQPDKYCQQHRPYASHHHHTNHRHTSHHHH